ncbi:MAG: hypothetical protein U9O98_02580 [Asgard group archaeon]|nr:hypothetical protein [Asgard group archaeon]
MFFHNPINHMNLTTGTVSVIISFLILAKNPKAIINILFFLAQFFWGLSNICNALTFLFSQPTFGAQLIRDLTTTFAILAAYFTFITGFSLYKGVYFLKKIYVNIPSLLVVISSIVIVVFFDHVVYDNDNGVIDTGTGLKTTQPLWVKIFLYGIPLILTIIAIIYFNKTRIAVEEEIIKKRISFFIYGFISIIFGSLILVIGGILEQILPTFPLIIEYISWGMTSILYFFAPVLMLIGFYLKKVELDDLF